jgi:diguanylate cyclase (GGDEF)-like protein
MTRILCVEKYDYTLSTKDHYYQNNNGLPREFDATAIRAMPDFSWMMVDLAEQVRKMGQMVDEVDRLSQTDVVSQLPNLRMAMIVLENSLKQANDHKQPLAILMLDNDNLRLYNQISYEAGDEAIRLLGHVLKDQLRQTDFQARWRMGDEFLIILPDTTEEAAFQVGCRVCAAVEEASQSRLFPSTISGGIAIYPKHGPTLNDLLHSAEVGLKAAKKNGKNRVVVGEERKSEDSEGVEDR